MQTQSVNSGGSRLLSTTQAAQYLGVSPRTIGRLSVTGELQPLRYFKYPRYDRNELDTFIERLKEQR